MVNGQPAKRLLAVVLLLLTIVITADVWDRRRWPAARLFSLRAILLLMFLWCGAAAMSVAILWQTWSSQAAMVGWATAATLIIPWSLWICRVPTTWSRRWLILGAFAMLTLPFHAYLRPDGLAGNGRTNFRWRTTSTTGMQAVEQPLSNVREIAGRGRDDGPILRSSGPLSPARKRAVISRTPTQPLTVSPSSGLGPAAAGGEARTACLEFRGPARSGVWPDTRLANWNDNPPREMWRRRVGAAWSSFVVDPTGLAITQEQQGAEECVTAYDLLTGSVVWQHRDPIRFDTSAGGTGPRATPTLVGKRLYAVGATGRLNCLDATSGEAAWSVDTVPDGHLPIHGIASSPLVHEAVVYVCPGEQRGGPSLAAYDARDGKPLWQAGRHAARYSSPMLATIDGVPQILLFHHDGVSSFDPRAGRELWFIGWANSNGNSISQPVVHVGQDNRVLVSTGYGQGGLLFELDRPREPRSSWQTREVWVSRQLKTKFSSPVLSHDVLYALNDSVLVAVQATSGKTLWKGGHFGYGQLLGIGDHLIVQAERGELVQLALDPTSRSPQPVEVGRLAALSDKTWNYPTFAEPYLLVRNDREAICFELPTPE